MGPPTDLRPSGSARVSKWSVHPWLDTSFHKQLLKENSGKKMQIIISMMSCSYIGHRDHGDPMSLPKLKKAYEKGTRGI
ncbi:unnamed protein product, partial [Staurois parvus]